MQTGNRVIEDDGSCYDDFGRGHRELAKVNIEEKET